MLLLPLSLVGSCWTRSERSRPLRQGIRLGRGSIASVGMRFAEIAGTATQSEKRYDCSPARELDWAVEALPVSAWGVQRWQEWWSVANAGAGLNKT